MDLRDKNNTVEGYNSLLEKKIKNIANDYNDIKELEASEKKGIQIHRIPNSEVIQNNFNEIYDLYYDIFFIKYSLGEDILDIIKDCINVIDSMENVWKKISGYVEMVNMLSVGIMLEIENKYFDKLVHLVKSDNPKDYVVDLLIHYKMPEWERANKKFMWKKPYSAFEEIETLSKTNKEDATMRLKKYLQKQWLPANDTGQSRGKSYHRGYWSFESGAIVKILQLDDTIIKDLNYYPYDMVQWKK
ncbi:MAG: DUF1911 domain-containing protein [Spirochaetales bacterium]|nr:DUF1911 domain-containing protein [Spirochaetales bacterium]